jgi:hypothetical protein
MAPLVVEHAKGGNYGQKRADLVHLEGEFKLGNGEFKQQKRKDLYSCLQMPHFGTG